MPFPGFPPSQRPTPGLIRPLRFAVPPLFPALFLNLLLPLLLLGWSVPASSAQTETVPVSRVGSGELLRRCEDGFRPMPLLGMEVGIVVTDVVVRGRIDQVFFNPDPVEIEAIYVFPLPERASVDVMEMRIGDRLIRSVVREREEARRAYEEARDTGRKAALIEEERPNLFTASVANINPGENVTIHLEYLEEIEPEGDRYELAFPLTLTPRYSPDAPAEPWLATSHGPGDGRSAKEVSLPMKTTSRVQPPFHPLGEPLAPRAILSVTLASAGPLQDIRSVSHEVVLTRGTNVVEVRPSDRTVVADRDFLLEWRIPREDEPTATAYVENIGADRYLLVTVQPPSPAASVRAEEAFATETLFVLDVSGSMDGPSIVQARDALLHSVEQLRPRDRFNVLWFNNRYGSFSPGFVPVDDGEMRRARSWIRNLEASGGTEIRPAFLRAMELCSVPGTGAQRRIIFLTDGAVSNEEDLLRDVIEKRGDLRIHVIGIGHAPNRYLMSTLAEEGRGLYESIAGNEEVGPRLERFLERIDRPVLADLSLRGLPADAEVSPSPLPDLYRDAALRMSVRIPGGGGAAEGASTWTLEATWDGRPWTHSLQAISVREGAGVGTRWARHRVDDALGRLRRGAEESGIRAEVVDLGLTFHLVTPYTSLVAVEERATALGPTVPAPVANALPAGSHLGGTLPRGGTNEGLFTLLGWICTGLGASLLFWIGVARRPE